MFCMGSLVGSKVFERQIKTLVDSNDLVLSVERKSSVRCNRILACGIVKGFLAKATANIIELCLIILSFPGVNYWKLTVNGVDKNKYFWVQEPRASHLNFVCHVGKPV